MASTSPPRPWSRRRSGSSSGVTSVCNRLLPGTTLLQIGDLPAAQRCLSVGLSTLDDHAARDRNLYLVRLTETQLRAGRSDEARHTAGQAVEAAAGIDSPRVAARMTQLLAALP